MTDLKNASLDKIITELQRRASTDRTPNHIDGKWVPPEYIIPENERLKTYGLLELVQKILKIVDERAVDITDVYEY